MDEQWVSFRIADELYVHSTTVIREVIPYLKPSPVPGTPDFVTGILNVRGQVVTVVSARGLLSQGDRVNLDDQKVLVLELAEELVGVCVDSVGDIVSFESDQVQWSDTQSDSKIIRGTVKLGDILYIVTDFAEYCRDISEKL